MDTTFSKNVNFIHRLPPEILIRIFFLSQKQTQRWRYPHLRLSWVCRHWREIINGFSGFWTVIQFSPWKGREFIQELVSRSGSAQLSVFSPYPNELVSPDIAHEILAAFNEFLECASHRIKFLFITDRQNRDLAKILAGKMLPVLNFFIFHEHLFGTSEELGEIMKSTGNLQYLEINPVLSVSSLSELQPCFHRLKSLVVPITSASVAVHLLSCLELCINLESLVIKTETVHPIIISGAYPRRSLPNLTSLYIDDYTIMDHLRVPALRQFMILNPSDYELPEPSYSFLDECDLSSITHLSILGYNTLSEPSSTIWIRGSAGLMPRHRLQLSLFEDDSNVDIRGDILPSIPFSKHTQFSLATRTHYRNVVVGTAVGSGSHFIPNFSSKLPPKLRNVETLQIDPYYMAGSKPYDRHAISDIKISLGIFFKRVFDTFISERLRWLLIKDTQGHLDLLQIMFNAINECPSLTNLETITFRVRDDTSHLRYKIGGHIFGKELVNFLRLRQAAGYPTLQKFELESSRGIAFTGRWITEAAALGTHIFHVPYKSRHADFNVNTRYT